MLDYHKRRQKNGESDFETDLHSIALEELCANKKGKAMFETVRRAIELFEQRGQRRAIDQEGMSRLKIIARELRREISQIPASIQMYQRYGRNDFAIMPPTHYNIGPHPSSM